ncbi:MAG: vWA domain-containing protein [Bacillota bacterium]|nr:vWA domain-containing protein [Bacillota bacterium]
MRKYALKSGLLALSLALLIIAGLLPAVASAESAAGGETSPAIGTDHPTLPGEVMLFQEAKPAAGLVNAWDVTLRIEARDFQLFSDIVLVIDTSKAAGTRLGAAKTAAKHLIDKLLPSDIARIGVVSFNTEATVVQELTNDAALLETAIDSLTTAGAKGTFHQAGIDLAHGMLVHGKCENSHLILFSGTLPTFSYKIPNDAVRRAGYELNDTGVEYLTGSSYEFSDFGTTRPGLAMLIVFMNT